MSLALITGSCGLVGSESVNFFCDKGFDVIGIDNDLRKMDKYNHSNTGLYILNYNKEIFSLKLSNDRTHIK